MTRRGAWLGVCAALLLAVGVGRASAQRDTSAVRDSTHRADSAHVDSASARDSTAHPRKHPARPVVHDTISGPPVSPVHAMLYSFAVPGLGQSKLHRTYTGAFFFSIEAICFAQLRQAIIDKHYASHHSPDSIVASYVTDPATGMAQLDSVGNPVPATFAYNRYSGGRLGARSLHVEDWVAALIFNHLVSGADAFVSAELWDLPSHVRAPQLEIFRDSGSGRMIYALSFPAPRFANPRW